MMLDRDQFNHVNPEQVAHDALRVMDILDHDNPERQVAGLAVALLAVVRRTGADRQDLMTVADNILADKAVRTPAYSALQDYIHHEVAR